MRSISWPLRMTVWFVVAALVGGLSGGAAAEDGAVPEGWLRGPDGSLPNVLLLTIDTLRADHLGFDRSVYAGLSPHVDELAAGGTMFLSTLATAPATLPALSSLHSGRPVGGHGASTNRGKITKGVPLLAERMREMGYATAAIYGNKTVGPRTGLDRGFETYDSFAGGAGSWDQRGATRAIRWIEQRPRAPWFLWLHFMDPHGPYNSAPSKTKPTRPDGDPLPDVELRVGKGNYGFGMIPKYQVLRARKQPLRDALRYQHRYREEVRFTDVQIGRVLEVLRRSGVLDSTLVVLSADHGESLGEHDYYFQHGWLPYQPTLRVPLMFRLPGKIAAGHRIEASTSTVDLFPTLVAGLGLGKQPGLAGRDLGPALRGGELADGDAFAVTSYLNQMTTLRRGRWKVVHTPPPPKTVRARDSRRDLYAEGESWALHDVVADPAEETDVSSLHSETFAELRRELTVWEQENGHPHGMRQAPPPVVDEQTRERLRALGYGD